MCEMDDKRRNTLANIGLMVGSYTMDIKSVRKWAEGLRVKDMEALDKLEAAMYEAAKYLADELEGSQ